jgi:hypothetical protein
MNGSDDDPFTRALRNDLPAPGDEARVRSRLVSAGVIAGAVAAPVGTAAAAGGVTAKVVALPLALKVGASLAVVGLVTVPVVSHLTSAPVSRAPIVIAATVTRPVSMGKAAPAPVTEPAPAALTEPAQQAEPMEAPAPAARETARPSLREPAKTRPSSLTKALPSVASFEDTAGPKPLDEGSLRAETALIERALSALKRDDVATARAALLEHARKFPNGHLVRERERALERTLGKETEPHAN